MGGGGGGGGGMKRSEQKMRKFFAIYTESIMSFLSLVKICFRF